MTSRLCVWLLLLVSTACGAARVARLDVRHEESTLHLARADETVPVELGREEVARTVVKHARQWEPSPHPERAARELWSVPSRSGWYGYTQQRGIVALDGQPSPAQWAEADRRMTQEYLRFCEALGQPGDCRRVLMDTPVLTGDGRYTLAMSFALEEVLPELMESFQGMADPEVLKASLLWTMTLYAALWLAPEPFFSKGLATGVTAGFICYVGVDTLWTLIQGWRRLVEVADLAGSLSALREAGRQYGQVMGRNAARAFALLLSAALGQTASGFVARFPTLPGAAQASAVGLGRAGVQLARVEAVTMTAEGVTLALAPNAVAITAEGLRGAASGPVDAAGPEHHIATDKWDKATHGGGPWSPRFRKLFERAGMTLDDPANKVRIPGHRGPHPEEYHQEVFERLSSAMRGCRQVQQCGEALRSELFRLRDLLSTPNTRLNMLVTDGASR